MHFRHERAADAHAPGFYLHLQPGNCFMGVGLWRPESKVAYAIRAQIDAEPRVWTKATRSKKFTDIYALGGDSLKRQPKGYEADHPLIDDLKRKDFMATTKLKQSEITSAGFMDHFHRQLMAAKPMMAFLCKAVDIPF